MKNTHNLRLKFRKFKRQHKTARMQDQIETFGKQFYMTPQSLAHPPLDTVAFVRFAEDLSGSKAHTRARRH